jgi:hypothetical protein
MKPAASILPNLSLRRPVTVQQCKISCIEQPVRSDNKIAENSFLDGQLQSGTKGTGFGLLRYGKGSWRAYQELHKLGRAYGVFQ